MSATKGLPEMVQVQWSNSLVVTAFSLASTTGLAPTTTQGVLHSTPWQCLTAHLGFSLFCCLNKTTTTHKGGRASNIARGPCFRVDLWSENLHECCANLLVCDWCQGMMSTKHWFYIEHYMKVSTASTVKQNLFCVYTLRYIIIYD